MATETTKKYQRTYLDTDYLKSFGVEPHYFGLGFIQLKILDNMRLHFYHQDLPVLVEEPHDHRYHFKSYILKGNFTQEIYRFIVADGRDNVPTHYLDMDDCAPGIKSTDLNRTYGKPHLLGKFHFSEGDEYLIDSDTLHTVKASDNCITLLERTTPHKKFATICRPMNGEKVCPFSNEIPAHECWDMIEDMIGGSNTGEAPGYHLRDIHRGEIGEVSKIIEEATELLDAHEQGVVIMQEIELSDLYGAMIHYMEKYHSDISMADLKDMHEVTRRAFENGKR